jgi:hypothetical protein
MPVPLRVQGLRHDGRERPSRKASRPIASGGSGYGARPAIGSRRSASRRKIERFVGIRTITNLISLFLCRTEAQ